MIFYAAQASNNGGLDEAVAEAGLENSPIPGAGPRRACQPKAHAAARTID